MSRKRGQQKETKYQYVIFSYMPLLTGVSGQTLSLNPVGASELASLVESLPSGNVDGCAWFMDDDVLKVIFMMKDASLIYEHLNVWADDKPQEWFTLTVLWREPSSYAIALMPDLEKSHQRWTAAFTLRNGFAPVPGKVKYLQTTSFLHR